MVSFFDISFVVSMMEKRRQYHILYNLLFSEETDNTLKTSEKVLTIEYRYTILKAFRVIGTPFSVNRIMLDF